MNKIEILDCTLRDGSYVIDNHFTKSDTTLISSVLFNSGINYVEVGHGLGLGANGKKYGKSLCTDDEYIFNSSQSKINKKNKVGVFCFPSIATFKQIKSAKVNGLDFIRIGVDLNDINKSKKIIEYSKELDLKVFANLVKTYSYSALDIAKKAQKLEKFGADIICLVDSAGAMLPDEIKNYFKTSKKFLNKDTLLNFHGHNNLGFANSNCMHAIDGGAKIIDTSIMGMGRSAGNAVTEMMIPVLQRKGLISKKVDLITILNLANKIISNLNPKNQYQPESILYGKSYFHSGFRGKLLSFTKKNKISFYNTLNNFSFKKILSVNDDLLKNGILNNKKIKYSYKTRNIKYPPIKVDKKLEFNDILSFKKYLKSEKQRLKSQLVISFCRSKKNNFKIIDNLQNYIIAHFESESEAQDKLILKNFKNIEIFIDEKIYKKIYLKQKNINKYSEDKIYQEAKNLFLKTKTKYKKFEIPKNSKYKLINKTKNPLIITKTIDNRNIKLLKMIKIPFNLLIYENLKIELKKLKNNFKNLKKVFRLNYGFILSLEILKLLNAKRFYELNFGKKVLFNKIPIISGGIVGEDNSLVVDNVENPSRIIGFADGYGGIKNQKISLDKEILLGKLILDQTNDFPN